MGMGMGNLELRGAFLLGTLQHVMTFPLARGTRLADHGGRIGIGYQGYPTACPLLALRAWNMMMRIMGMGIGNGCMFGRMNGWTGDGDMTITTQ